VTARGQVKGNGRTPRFVVTFSRGNGACISPISSMSQTSPIPQEYPSAVNPTQPATRPAQGGVIQASDPGIRRKGKMAPSPSLEQRTILKLLARRCPMRNKYRSQTKFSSFKRQRRLSANTAHLSRPRVSPVWSLPCWASSTGPSRVFVSTRDLLAILEVL
jgi:hypothetical protein